MDDSFAPNLTGLALSLPTARVSRVSAAHTEGYLEGFANVYTVVAAAILAACKGKPAPEGSVYPTVRDGLRGVQFVSVCVKSSARNAAWVALGH